MDLIPVRCRIPELLEKKNRNQQWLADRTGMRKQRISDIVHLRMDNITIKRAALIAHHLDCKIDDLFEWEWR